MPPTETDTQTTPKPILMSAWSVRRILANAKTETRRVLNPQPEDDGRQVTVWFKGTPALNGMEYENVQPDWNPGDRLYVREPVYKGDNGGAHYEADDEPVRLVDVDEPPWTFENDQFERFSYRVAYRGDWSRDRQPSMFMPKAWSRILLEVREVEVERLQEIHPEDAYAEGIAPMGRRHADGLVHEVNPVEGFIKRWNDLHGDGAWEANPWVWRIAFSVIHPRLN